MEEEINQLKNEFYSIKRKQWIKGLYSGTCNIGKTFEKLLGIEDNTFEIPDYNGIEIKTKKHYSKSYTSLFCMNPSSNEIDTIKNLKDKYGYPDTSLKEYKVLNNSVFCTERTWIGNRFQFMLKVDKIKEKIILLVFDIDGKLIEKNVYWDFDIIKEKLERKMKIVAYVSAYRKIIDDIEYFRYYKMEIYLLKNFNKFIELMEQGIIRISFKISVYKDEKRKGQIYNHGTSFDIQKKDFDKLFDKYKTFM